MKKKLLAMTLASAMCVGMLAGCGGGSSASTDGGDSGAGSGSGDAYNISVIVKLTDGHFNKVMAGAKAYADEHDNVKVDIQSPTSATSYDEQVNMIETSLGNPSIDALVLAPLQSDSASTLVANTDKVVIALDTDFTSDKKLAFVGTGNKDAAKSGGISGYNKETGKFEFSEGTKGLVIDQDKLAQAMAMRHARRSGMWQRSTLARSAPNIVYSQKCAMDDSASTPGPSSCSCTACIAR